MPQAMEEEEVLNLEEATEKDQNVRVNQIKTLNQV